MGSVSSKSRGGGSANRRGKSLSVQGEHNHQNNHIICQAESDQRSHRPRSQKSESQRLSESAPSLAASSSSSRSSSNICTQLHPRSQLCDSSNSIPAAICLSNNNNKHVGQRVPSPIQLGIKKSDFKVVKLKVGIDKKVTSLDEKSSAVLKYRTPHFRAHATVEIPPLSDKQSIRLGWIQTCINMKFVNTYGKEGVTSWEFPEIVSGKFTMISDADGKQYPWYGSKHEVQTIQGPCSKQLATVHMNDNFFPQVTWYIPHTSFDRTARLTHIHRKQDFLTFLVIKDLYCDTYHVLKAVTWSMNINVEVHPENALGRRAKLLEPYDQTAPTILPEDQTPSPDAHSMRPPNANNSQTLVWRPLTGEPQIVVPPEQTTVDLDKYTLATRDYIEHLLES